MSFERRCPGCGRLLLRGEFSWVEIRCPRCRRLLRIEAPDPGDRAATRTSRPETQRGPAASA